MRLRALLIAAVLAVLAAVPADAPAARRGKLRLRAFASCTGLIGYARRHVPPQPPAPPRPVAPPISGGGDDGAPQPAPRAESPAAGGGEGGTDTSTTNVQEAGVDEPDSVKTDGNRIFALARGALHAVDARAATPRLLGSLRSLDGFGEQLLLHGDRALVVSQGAGKTILSEIDVSNPAAMRVLRTLTVDGEYVSARLHGATARVVISSVPRAVPVPLPGPVSIGAPDAVAARRAPLRARRAGWVPSATLRTRRKSSTRVRRRAAVACTDVRRTPEFTGADMLTVLTIDMERGLPAIDSDAVMTDAETVYASTGSLYVATRADDADATSIHRFDVSRRDATAYKSTGEVAGTLLNQFALSEHGGVLRAASTTTSLRSSESYVTVLQERDGRLVQVGRVGNLGRDERIYAVRFIEDTGFVVTFRQTDPLYTLDLSVPSQPRVRGELKILGYSAYLHPLGDNLLLGVGQDATAEGSRLGSQLSLFDVTDLAAPVRLAQRSIGTYSTSEAEYDHHAFLWWPKTQLAVLPLDAFGEDPSQRFSGALGFRVARETGIADAGRVSHPAGAGAESVRRALVVGDRLFTLSDGGLMTGSAEMLGAGQWLPFPG